MRYLNLFYRFIALFIIPALIFYPAIELSATSIHTYTLPNATESSQNQVIAGYSFTYDDILALVENLENGTLEKNCTIEELERINHFIVLLAKKGILPSEIDKTCILENDIEELFYGDDIFCEYLFSFDQNNNSFIVPSIYSGHNEIILCKSWVHKKWDQTKKFVKKHKKAIIIGTAVVVAAAVVICAVALASTAAAAGAAAAAAAAAGSDEKDKNQSQIKEDPVCADDTSLHHSLNEASIFKETLEEHSSMFKEVIEDDFLQTSSNSTEYEETSFKENIRNLGAILAHQALDGISELTISLPHLLEEMKDIRARIVPEDPSSSNQELEDSPRKNYEELIAAGHEKIDQVFLTDQAMLYTPEAKEKNNKFAIGILPPPGAFWEISATTSKLIEAGKAIDRAGFTKAGRALTKHSYREDSIFPKPVGTPTQVNEHGQRVLEAILNHPERKVTQRHTNNLGEVIDIFAPNLGGVRFSASGEMIGFLEP